MSSDQFFEERKEQSLVKSTIVSKYFYAWAKVIIPSAKKHHNNKIGYIDLFSGPGYYDDGTESTPLLVLKKAIQDLDMRNMLITIFNDKNHDYVQSLENAINKLPGIDDLKYKPEICNYEVGEDLVKKFEDSQIIPTLSFVDPWGYKGLSRRLISALTKNWGCDCIFFFNFNRINAGLDNPRVKEHMDALFGVERAEELRTELKDLRPRDRELTIVEEITQALKDVRKYVLPFCFKNDKGNRTTHHLIFVSKHKRGYGIMKEIMAGESSGSTQGIPSFEYSPATSRQTSLFDLSRPLEDLGDMLMNDFAGRTLKTIQIYDEHNLDRPYILKNYKDILTQLETEEKIKANPPADKRPKRKGKVTFGDNVKVTFPPRSG